MTLKSKSFKLSRTKTKYLEHKFNNITQEVDLKVRLDAQLIPKRKIFKYLGSIIQVIGRLIMSHIILERDR